MVKDLPVTIASLAASKAFLKRSITALEMGTHSGRILMGCAEYIWTQCDWQCPSGMFTKEGEQWEDGEGLLPR